MNRVDRPANDDETLPSRSHTVGLALVLALFTGCVGSITGGETRLDDGGGLLDEDGAVAWGVPEDELPARWPRADGGMAGIDAGAILAPGARGPDHVWSPLSVMAVANPMEHGAAGDGKADDLGALRATVEALPEAGGIVYLPAGRVFKKTNALVITQDHVKFWAPSRQAEIFQSVSGQRRRQALLCRNNTGCGFFGLKLRSDAAARFDALEDNQIAADHGKLVEVAGCEIQGSAAVGVFLYGSSEQYVEGNYIHHTWGDHVHHTDGASSSWVWNNFIFNEAPSKGDDGVACVTYGLNSARCRDMEWWNNRILRTGWGRGYAVIGGDKIHIHHNWAIGVAGAGVIVASESAHETPTSQAISIANNYIYQCGEAVVHPGILLSGAHATAGPLTDISLDGNVSVESASGAYRAEGSYKNVTNANLLTARNALPEPMPSSTDVRMADSSVLRTRDVSHVKESTRPGLYRIHVRVAPSGSGFEQRFEYLVKGPPDALSAFAKTRQEAGDYLAEQRTVGATGYALVLTGSPFPLPSGLSGVSFRDLRANDRADALAWLWQRVDKGDY